MDTSKIPIINIFVGRHLKWQTSLSTTQVLKEIGNLPSHRLFGSGGQLVTAEVSGQKFSMICMGFGGIGMSGNAFEHVGFGKVETTPNGSEVKMYFRLRLHIFIFFAIWMTGAIFGSLIGLIGSIYHLITNKGNWQNSETAIPFSIIFLSVALLFPWFGRRLASKNEIKIVNTLSEILQCQPEP